jgi:hypothetical protein
MQLLFLEKGMPLFELNPSKILEYQIQSIYYRLIEAKPD